MVFAHDIQTWKMALKAQTNWDHVLFYTPIQAYNKKQNKQTFKYFLRNSVTGNAIEQLLNIGMNELSN